MTKRAGDACVRVSLKELLDLKKNVNSFSLSKDLNSSNRGMRISRLLASGMEFSESRCYLPGDDVRNIDWKVTARAGKAHTKLFAEEKSNKVVVAVDARAPMFFASQGVFKSVQAALIAGNISWKVTSQGKRFCALLFDDEEITELPPAILKNKTLPFLQSLQIKTDFKPKEHQKGTCSMDQAMMRLRKMATPGSSVFLLSDFRNLTPYGKDLLKQIAVHSEICLCFFYDSLEVDLPKNGYYPVTDGQVEKQLNTYDKKCLENYRKKFAERRENIASLASNARIRFIECSSTDDCLEVLQKSFR